MNEEFDTAARDLVDRLGDGAKDRVLEMIAGHVAVGNMRKMDEGYRLLSAVERHLEGRRS